jgi:hypothetical protein
MKGLRVNFWLKKFCKHELHPSQKRLITIPLHTDRLKLVGESDKSLAAVKS